MGVYFCSKLSQIFVNMLQPGSGNVVVTYKDYQQMLHNITNVYIYAVIKENVRYLVKLYCKIVPFACLGYHGIKRQINSHYLLKG